MEEKEVKEIIQDVELRLNAENKAKLKFLKINIFKFQMGGLI